MPHKSIITQSSLGGLRFILSEIASDLSAHANASLSKAHGIDVLYFPGGLLDSYNNDVGFYRDSNGDIIGTHQVRFSVNNIIYYAPASATALDGQPEATGIINEQAIADTLNAAGGSAWTTEFGSTYLQDAASIRSDVLIPHTQLGHWESHRPIAVFPKNTFDSAGHKVGNYVAIFQWNGTVYEIPCDTRLGGPIQPPRILTHPIPAWTSEGKSGGGAPDTTIFAACTGTSPITFQWQVFWQSPVWTDITDNTTYGSIGGRFNYVSGTDPSGTGTSTSLFVDIEHTGQSSNSSEYPAFLFRCAFSNPGGTVYTNESHISAYDQTDSCALISATIEAQGRPFTPYEAASLWRLHLWARRHRPDEQDFYSGGVGHGLVERMKSTGFDFRQLNHTAAVVLSKKLPASKRYQMLRQAVVWAMRHFWPDCPHPVWRKETGQ